MKPLLQFDLIKQAIDMLYFNLHNELFIVTIKWPGFLLTSTKSQHRKVRS